MSIVDPQAEDEPRRGARVRKQVDRFETEGRRKSKGKQRDEAADDEEEQEQEEAEEGSEDDDPAPARRTGKKRTSTGAQKKASRPRKRKSKEGVEADVEPGEQIEGIKNDCPLFNALLSPDIALQPVIEDWVETYQQTANDDVSERASVHELVLFCIRCCGLSSDVDEDEAMDIDGTVDTIERIQDEIVRTSSAMYPLISRAKNIRPFKTNVNLFIPHLIKTLSLSPLLYETPSSTKHSIPVLNILLRWLLSMSSSPLRPIRHTSTYLALKINSALCDIAGTVSEDLSLRQRQKEAEVKKGGQGPAAQKRVKDLESKVREALQKKQRLEEYMDEIFSVLFVHRVRDADPAIRTDCLRELGVWVKKYGEVFVDTGYLTYFARGCNDPNSHPRLETVKALSSLFASDHHVSRARSVILRLTPRLVQIALRDVDLSVRVHALSVIAQIDEKGILEDADASQRPKVARLIFDREPRIRKAVSSFIRGLWKERVDQLKSEWTSARPNVRKRAGKATEDEMEERFSIKALASLLVETGDSLDESAETSRQGGMVAGVAQIITRAGAAVEALRGEFEQLLREWERLVEYLLLDHSEGRDMWLLENDEETFMLQVLVACIKQDEEPAEDEEDLRTKTLIDVLPRLFAKHRADPERMAGILSVVEQMNLALYLDMRKGTAYETLWDDVTKQFLQHSDPLVLTAAMKAINHLCANASMVASNDIKSTEMEEAVFSSLRDGINGEDVFSMSMDEDRLVSMQAFLLRLCLLLRSKDMTEAMSSEEGGQSSGWEIVLAFVERGEVGYKEESKIVDYAIQIIFLQLTWMFKSFKEEDGQDSEKTAALRNRVERAAQIFEKLAVQGRSNPAEVVRRQAFISYLNLYMLFSNRGKDVPPAAKACALVLPDAMQHRLAAAFGTAASRFADELSQLDDEDDDAEARLEKLQNEFVFLQVASVFVGAMRCGVLDVSHAKEPMAYYGRFGPTYDAIIRKLVDVLRDEGIYNKEADTVQNVVGSALQASFNAFMDTDKDEPLATNALAKVIASAFVVQGTHFTVLRQINPTDAADLHLAALDYLSKKLLVYDKQMQPRKSPAGKNVKDNAMRRMAQALSFFKALILLLGPINSRDALRIRETLEKKIRDGGAKVTASKAWEAYKAYERRLFTIISKDPTVKIVAQTKPAETDGEAGSAAHSDGAMTEGEVEDEEMESQERVSPAKRSLSRSQDRPLSARENEEEDDEMEIGDEPRPFADMDLNLDIDLSGMEDIELDLQPSQGRGRARSISVEPTAKKRKTVRKM